MTKLDLTIGSVVNVGSGMYVYALMPKKFSQITKDLFDESLDFLPITVGTVYTVDLEETLARIAQQLTRAVFHNILPSIIIDGVLHKIVEILGIDCTKKVSYDTTKFIGNYVVVAVDEDTYRDDFSEHVRKTYTLRREDDVTLKMVVSHECH